MNEMQASAGVKLIPITLSSTENYTMRTDWIVYKQIASRNTTWQTTEPFIVKMEEILLDLHRSDGMDRFLFQRELVAPVQQNDLPGQIKNEEMPENEEEEIRPEKIPPKALDVYDGTLRWIWKRMDCSTARVEIIADTGKENDREKPVLSAKIQYSPNDKYAIGGMESIPSGIPLSIRIYYQNNGRDVKDEPVIIQMKAPKSRLEVNSVTVKEGRFFNKKTYLRLILQTSGAFTPDHVAVASSTGFVYSADWEPWEGGWRSELLPEGEYWRVVDRPGDLIEYEIIQ